MTEAKAGVLSQIEQLKAENPNLVFSPAALEYLKKFDAGETDGITCWRVTTVERKPGSEIQGVGLFAKADIEANSVIAIKPGRVVSAITVRENTEVIKGSHQQIGQNSFLTGLTPQEVDKNLVGYNHSCDPNAKVAVQDGLDLAFLVSKKPIKKGEEITADYSTSQASNTHRIFFCQCKNENCRHLIQPGYDWQNEQFQSDHFEDFPYFIKEKIAKFQSLPEHMQKYEKRVYLFFKCADMMALLSDALGENPSNLKIDNDREYCEKMLNEYAQALAKLCPFNGNLEDMGIDPDQPETVTTHLQELVDFARNIDRTFN